MKILVAENFTLRNGSLKLHRFEVEVSELISALKIDISNKISIESSNFDLYLNDFLLDNNKSIESFLISENSILKINLLDSYTLNSVNDQDKYLIISIEQFSSNERNGIRVEEIHVKSNCEIKIFQNQLKCEGKIHNLKSLLHLNRLFNRVLENDKTFQENKVADYDEIRLIDNVALINYENCLYDAQVIRQVSLESEELNENLIKLCQAWNTDKNFISVIYEGNIIKEIPIGIYLSFICDGNDIDDSIIVYITECFTTSRVFSKHGILLNKSDSVSSAIVKIRRLLNIKNLDEIKIRFNMKILDLYKFLIDYGISNFSELVLVCKIHVKEFNSDHKLLSFWICLGDRVSELKSLLLTSVINKESFDLFFHGEKVLDNEPLSKYGIDINSILTLIDSIENISISNLILIDYEFLYLIPDSIQNIDLQSQHGFENRNMLSRNMNIDPNLMRIFYKEQIINSVANGKYFYFTQNNELKETVMIVLTEGFNENGQFKRHAILFNKTESVISLIEHIRHLLNIQNMRKLKIQFDEIVLRKSKILSEYNIINGSELKLLRRVSVKQLDSDEIDTYWICLENSFLKLKEMISSKLEINIKHINLYYFGELISDEVLLAKYEIDIDYCILTNVITTDEIISIRQCILINYENCSFNSNRFHQINFQFEDGYENRTYLSEITQVDLNLMSIIYNEEKVRKIPKGEYLYSILENGDIDKSIIAYVEESFSEVGKIMKHAISINKNDSVESVKRRIIDDLQMNCYEFEIRFNEVNLNSNDTLLDYKMISGLSLTMLYKIIITRLNSKDSYSFWMFPNDSIAKLKQFISTDLKVNVSQINLFFLGKLIPDEETLSNNGILRNSEILMSEEKLSVCSVTLVNYKECHLSKNLEIDKDRILEINFKSEDLNENRHELSRVITKNYNLINIIYMEETITVIPNGKYLYFVHDSNYGENSIIVFVKESLSTSGELKTLGILINKTDKISSVLEKINKIVDREEQLKIRFNENVLENDCTLLDYDIKNGSELTLLFLILIKDLRGSRNFSLFISLCDTVKILKNLISSKSEEVNAEQIKLTIGGENMEDDKLCSVYEIDSGTTLMMLATIKGGEMVKF